MQGVKTLTVLTTMVLIFLASLKNIPLTEKYFGLDNYLDYFLDWGELKLGLKGVA
jgi:hypothetical protein